MEIQVNGEAKTYPSDLNLQSLIAELNIGNQAIAGRSESYRGEPCAMG